MKIREIMNINAARVQTGTSLRLVAEQFVYTGASDLCAVDADGRFVGVISEGDVMRAALPGLSDLIESGGSLADAYQMTLDKGKALADTSIDKLIIRDPIVLSPDDPVHKAAGVMSAKQIRRLPVVDKGLLVGTVSRADVCRAVFH